VQVNPFCASSSGTQALTKCHSVIPPKAADAAGAYDVNIGLKCIKDFCEWLKKRSENLLHVPESWTIAVNFHKV
jgi:hypothetical protein